VNRSHTQSERQSLLHHGAVAVGAAVLTLAFFLVLPLIQAIAKAKTADTLLRTMDTAVLPPPPPPPPEPEQDEPDKQEPPPELEPDAPPPDLSQLELALNPGVGGGWTTADFAVKLKSAAGGGADGDNLFSLADLDQKPRAIYQLLPTMTPQMRRKGGGTVYVLFVVDESGRVENPIVHESPDPVYDKPALDAVRKWKFEPGKRNGKPVRFRMRAPITFPGK
jgi:periplasmic protein TonB